MKLITTLYCLALLTPHLLQADFSIKKITSWVMGTKESTFFEEHPLEDNSTVIIEINSGTIHFKSWSLPKVAIEGLKAANQKDLENITIETLVLPHQLSIKTMNNPKGSSADFQLIVPVHTNIIAKTQYGSIKIKKVEGSLQLSTENGSIDIQNAANNVQAVSSGPIVSTFSSLPPHSSLSLKSLKGAVSITLPTTTHASFKATTLYNSIISQHFITLNQITMLLNKQTWDRFKKDISGQLGNGGNSTITISAYNGITILK